MSTKLRVPGPIVLWIVCVLLVTAAMAQGGATLRGVVVDPSGAVVPGAAITVTQADHTLHAKSGADGRYSLTLPLS